MNNVGNSSSVSDDEIFKNAKDSTNKLIELAKKNGVDISNIKLKDFIYLEDIKKCFSNNSNSKDVEIKDEDYSSIPKYNKYTQPEDDDSILFELDDNQDIQKSLQEGEKMLDDLQELIDKIDNEIKEEKKKKKEAGEEDIFEELDNLLGITIEDSAKSFRDKKGMKEKIKNYKYDSIKLIKLK